MNSLPTLSPEYKALNTAALLFLGVGLLFALSYLDVSHLGSKAVANIFTTPDEIAKAYYGPGMSIDTLLGLAHIHILGMFSMFWVIGFIFAHSTIALKWRIFWIVLPFAGFMIDVAGWFLTKLVMESFVYEVIIGGALMMTSMGIMILISLYQMWITPLRTR